MYFVSKIAFLTVLKFLLVLEIQKPEMQVRI